MPVGVALPSGSCTCAQKLLPKRKSGGHDKACRPNVLDRSILYLLIFYLLDRQKNAAPAIAETAPVVDDKGLEPLTSRTSSGSSTS